MKKEEITLKNTKAEILDALNEALEREKSISQTKQEPEKEEKNKKLKKQQKKQKPMLSKKYFQKN